MRRRFPPGSAKRRRNGGFALIIVHVGADRLYRRASDGERTDGDPHCRQPHGQLGFASRRRRRHLRGDLQSFGSAAGTALASRRHAASSRDRQQSGHLADRGRGVLDQPEHGFTRPPRSCVAGDRQRPLLAAGLDYGPPSAPFETLGELGRVLGMTPAVLMAIRPHLTLFGPPEPNPVSTDPVVAAALALSSPASQPVAQPGQASPDNLTVRITALASGPGNARVTRTAVVRTGATLPRGYAVLAWGNSLDSDAPLGSPRPPVTR
jgi:hypothetical protein